MTPKLTKAMAAEAIKDGAQVKDKRKVQRPPPPKLAITPDRGPELEALRAEIAQLKQALADEKNSADRRSQELSGMFNSLSENKPMRLKPIRDMERGSPTYLLVTHYDFVPVTYQSVKLNS
jgi:hypothetical protein